MIISFSIYLDYYNQHSVRSLLGEEPLLLVIILLAIISKLVIISRLAVIIKLAVDINLADINLAIDIN